MITENNIADADIVTDNATALAPIPAVDVERSEHVPDDPKVGDWVWIDFRERRSDNVLPHLGCVVEVGSNYADLRGPWPRGCTDRHYDTRWHHRQALADFWEHCRREPNASAIIAEEIAHYQRRTQLHLEEVRALTAQLGCAPEQLALPGGDVQALVRVTGTQPVEEYKAALVKAKTDELPALFAKVELANKMTAQWMAAQLIPLEAETAKLKLSTKLIEGRIFNVELYAGLCESVVQFADGTPAPISEPIRLLQRRHYMDEECLVGYEAGGMTFNEIGEFHTWLAKPGNRDRVLPHPRCVVAFRVRRDTRIADEVSFSDLIALYLGGDADKTTFLYLRNGERLYCLQTKIDFDERLFPDFAGDSHDGDRRWAKMCGTHVESVISDGLYQEMAEARAAYKAKRRQWETMSPAQRKLWAEAHEISLPEGDGGAINFWHAERKFCGPEPHSHFDSYEPYTPDSLYFDNISKFITAQMIRHNRLVIVLQGILDRSPVFHPHPPIQLGSAEDFARYVHLVYDDSRALTDGEPPDFEAYRARLNATLGEGSVVVGQEDVWLRREAERENEKYRPGRDRHTTYRRYRPTGDPGPGVAARIMPGAWAPRSRKATFRWERERVDWRVTKHGGLPCSIEVPASALLNVSAYRAGDFKQFFADPRTRADYLRWAPLLLRAEDYVAGKLALGTVGEGSLREP